MNKTIIELLDNIKLKKEEVINFTNENKLEDAKKSKDELVQLQNKLNILYDLEDDKEDVKNSLLGKEPIQNNEKITEEQAFITAIKNTALDKEIPKNVVNILKTTEEEKGILVPQDISTTVRELRRETQSLEQLVNIEKVEKTEGSRVIEKNIDIVGFEAVDEEAVFPDMPDPDFKKISYKLKKFGGILKGTQIITNQDGFNWLDKLKDENGTYILQPDITQKFDYLLFGKYPVIVFSNKQIKTNANKAPFYIGNLKEFITLFDYEKLFIEMSSEAGDLWDKDMIGIKVRERLDVQVIDENALVKGEVDITAPVMLNEDRKAKSQGK